MFKSLNHIISVVENQPHWRDIQQFRHLLKCWSQAVGTTVASQTRPHSISRDVLYVATSSSVWAQELKFKRRFILKKLNAQLPNPVTDIRFSTAQWQKPLVRVNSTASKPFDSGQKYSSWTASPLSTSGDGAASLSPLEQSTLPLEPHSAFNNWAEAIQTRSQKLPLCPQCQCPTPPEELQRWHVCSLCATKRWQA